MSYSRLLNAVINL